MLKDIEKYLADNGIEESRAEARLIVGSISGLNIEQILSGEKITDEAERKILEIAKERIETGKPIQHLLGFTYFMGKKFKVNENVLIPRDETELLVRKALEIIEKHNAKDILDIGTGSGCIACSIALNAPDTQVLGTDISTAALSTAIENAQDLRLINRAIFRKSDLFSNVREKFDIIVSNPPYIPLQEKDCLQKEVGFDPESALFTKDREGLEFYERIIKEAPDFLNPGGAVIFEVGQGQAQKVKVLFEKSGFKNISTIKDLAGIERVVCAEVS